MFASVGSYSGRPRRSLTFYETLRHLHLLDNLRVCLDAGDILSYSGGADLWRDRSGNGNDFYLGSGTGADSADPTHNGVSGRRTGSEYFSYDGGDRFTLAQSAPSWQSGMHKAGGAFTIIQWAYVGNLSGLAPSQAGFGCGDDTSSSSYADSITFTNSASTQNAISVGVTDSSGTEFLGNKSTLLVTNNAWQMVSVAVDIDARAIVFGINGSTESVSNVYSGSPGSTASHVPLVIGAIAPDGYASAISGCRIAACAIYTGALSAANLTSIFSATRSRFGV